MILAKSLEVGSIRFLASLPGSRRPRDCSDSGRPCPFHTGGLHTVGVRRTLTLVSALFTAMVLLVTGAVAQDGIGPYVFHGDFWKPKPLPETPAVGDHELTRPK